MGEREQATWRASSGNSSAIWQPVCRVIHYAQRLRKPGGEGIAGLLCPLLDYLSRCRRLTTSRFASSNWLDSFVIDAKKGVCESKCSGYSLLFSNDQRFGIVTRSAAQGIVVDVSKQVTKYAAMSSETDASAAGRSESDYVATPAKPSKAAVKGKAKQKSTTPATKVARVLSTACEETRKSDCTSLPAHFHAFSFDTATPNSGQCRFWRSVTHQESSSARSARRDWRSRG